MISAVISMSLFLGHHAVDVDYEAAAVDVRSQVFAWFLDADGWVVFRVLEASESNTCNMCQLWAISTQAAVPDLPRCTPFFVKKADEVLKFTPHPMTSNDEYFGPNCLPLEVQEKLKPSSP